MQDLEKLASKEIATEISSMAKKFKDSGLAPVLLFFLETTKPLNTVFHNLSLLFEPFYQPFFAAKTLGLMQQILEERTLLEFLIQELENKN